MKIRLPAVQRRGRRGRLSASHASVIVLSAALLGGTAAAYDFEMGEEVTGSIVTTLSVGLQVRMADRDPRNVGFYNGGRATAADADDGDLNYDKYDLTSQVTSVSSELRLKWRNYFATVSGTAFFDSIAARNDLAENGPEERPYNGRYSPTGKDEAEWDAEFREYYVGGNFTVFDRNLAVKVGSQILNWGEALFTLNGISVINGLDVIKILTPGAELKDALIPVPMLKLDYEVAEGLTAEAFVGFGFEPARLPACGAFMSFNDNVCEGSTGTSVYTDFGDRRAYTVGRDNFADYNNPAPPYGTGPQAISVGIPLEELDDPATTDWGASLRYFSPDLNNTEFQFYYVKYRSRLPSAYFKAPEHYAEGTGQSNFLQASQSVLGTALAQLGLEGQQQVMAALEALAPGFQSSGDLLTDLLSPALAPVTAQLFDPSLGTLPRSVVFENMDHSKIYQYYPDDIQMLGFAFSTTENYSGIAINGEISFKHDVPVLIAAPIFFGLALDQLGGVPIDQGTAQAQLPLGPLSLNNFGVAPYIEGPDPYKFDDQFIPGRIIRADERHDVWQAALRFTKIFGGTDLITMLSGATQVIGLIEFGGLHVDLNDGTPYAAYGQNGFSGFYSRPVLVAGQQVSPAVPATALGPPFNPTGRLPTEWSGGVQGIFFFDYPDLIDGVKLTPSFAFSHGLVGITPAPLPGFTKGMTSILVGLKAEFSQRFSVSASYFKSFGAGGGPGGSRNPFIDRDFVGVAATYQF
ncbi:DUF1302 family protein [Oleomonas cavernae]|uniref:DUF1302 family protein n=1 Tax=Oleomonas cavernae TaxID=2320859 RepID=A0A418WEB3_9PROT|nr:DUF1302 family protein [Oleomonas cavernae]RJF88340.1 DUF1302 family protein [Oleomonas cavernae]